MKKKATIMPMEFLIILILGLALIGTVVMVVSPEARVKTKNMLNEIFRNIPTEEGFVPYAPEVSEEEQEVINSIDALQCGISLTILNDPDWKNTLTSKTEKPKGDCILNFKDPQSILLEKKKEEEAKSKETSKITGKLTGIEYCCEKFTRPEVPTYIAVNNKEDCKMFGPGGVEVKGKIVSNSKCGIEDPVCNGILYGGICLECTNTGSSKFKSLPEDKTIALNMVTISIINCWIKSDQASQHRNSIPCDEIHTRNLGKTIISKSDILTSLRSQLPTGKKIIDSGKLFIGFDEIKNQRDREDQVLYLYYLNNHPLNPYHWDDPDGIHLRFQDDPDFQSDVFSKEPIASPSGCTIKGFELPQEFSTLDGWIPIYKDPKYVVMYEKFDRSEVTWVTDFKILPIVVMGTRLGADLLFVRFGLKDFFRMRFNSNMEELQRILTQSEKFSALTEAKQARILKLAAKIGDKGMMEVTKHMVRGEGVIFAEESANTLYQNLKHSMKETYAKANVNLLYDTRGDLRGKLNSDGLNFIKARMKGKYEAQGLEDVFETHWNVLSKRLEGISRTGAKDFAERSIATELDGFLSIYFKNELSERMKQEITVEMDTILTDFFKKGLVDSNERLTEAGFIEFQKRMLDYYQSRGIIGMYKEAGVDDIFRLHMDALAPDVKLIVRREYLGPSGPVAGLSESTTPGKLLNENIFRTETKANKLIVEKLVGDVTITGTTQLGRVAKRIGYKKLLEIFSKDKVELEKFQKALKSTFKYLKKVDQRGLDDVSKTLEKRFIEAFGKDGKGLSNFFEINEELKAAPSALGLGEIEILNSLEANAGKDIVEHYGSKGLGKRIYDKLGLNLEHPTVEAAVNFAKKTGWCASTPVSVVGGTALAFVAPTTVLSTAPLAGKGIINCLKAVTDIYLPLTVAISFMAELTDDTNQNYHLTRETKNTLLAMQPVWYDSPPIEREITTANNYYVALQKGPYDQPSRLFFASPCKTDINIYLSECVCSVNNNQYLQEFKNTDGRTIRQPIDNPRVKGITDFTEEIAWDKLTPEERDAYFSEKGVEGLGKEHASYSRGALLIAGYISSEPELFREFLDIVAPDPKTFYYLTLTNPLDPSERGNYYNIFYDIISFDQAKYNQFKQVLTSYITSPESVSLDFVYQINPTKRFYVSHTGQLESLHEYENKVLINYFSQQFITQLIRFEDWMNRDKPCTQIDNNCPYDRKTSEQLKTTSLDYTSISIQPPEQPFKNIYLDSTNKIFRMQAYKFLHTDLFNRALPGSSFTTFIFRGDSNNLVKDCKIVDEEAPTRTTLKTKLNMEFRVPCVMVAPLNVMDYKSAGWNNGNNYCYSTTNPTLKTTEEVLETLSVGSGLVAMVGLIPGLHLVGGGAFIASSSLSIASGISGLFIEYCTGWPQHQQSIGDCLMPDFLS